MKSRFESKYEHKSTDFKSELSSKSMFTIQILGLMNAACVNICIVGK